MHTLKKKPANFMPLEASSTKLHIPSMHWNIKVILCSDWKPSTVLENASFVPPYYRLANLSKALPIISHTYGQHHWFPSHSGPCSCRMGIFGKRGSFYACHWMTAEEKEGQNKGCRMSMCTIAPP